MPLLSLQVKAITAGLDFWRQAVEHHNEATMGPLPNVLPCFKAPGAGASGGRAGGAPGGAPSFGTFALESVLAYVACYLPPMFHAGDDA